jgi:hypothetical protein
VAGSADSFSIMMFMVNMFVVMLVLDCLVRVYGVRIEDRSEYQTCIANPAGCTRLYAAHPPPGQRVRARDALSVAEWMCGWGGGRRFLWKEGLTGTIPTTVGLFTSLTYLYAPCHPPPCVSG